MDLECSLGLTARAYPEPDESSLNHLMVYDMIWYICWLQLGCHPVAVVQYTFTRKQYTEQHKTNNT